MKDVIGKFLTIFGEISSIPRCSKHESAIGNWLCNWARERNLNCKKDEAGNILIEVPASRGYETHPKVIIQGHMDMVCEKGEGSDHDFLHDGIKLLRDGDWLRADNTTLGADNGVAIALGLMTVIEEIDHPGLELLFTVDEETGLTGANQLTDNFLTGKTLLNLDSEETGKFTIGCAGGLQSKLEIALETDIAPENSVCRSLQIGGLRGGHSGVDINKNRASAIKLMARVLYQLKEDFSFNLISLEGGTAHNAIARDARCNICIYPEDEEAMQKLISQVERDFRKEYNGIEPELKLTMKKAERVEDIYTEESTLKVTDFLMALPHGVSAMTASITDLVETSNNLATVRTEDNKLSVSISLRSSVRSRLRALSSRIAAVGELAGAVIEENEGYPAWEPDTGSELLQKCKDCYQAVFGEKPEVLIIHAGLECGVIAEKYPEMDMVSFGPDIENAHSPRERLSLSSLECTWRFLVKLLKSL